MKVRKVLFLIFFLLAGVILGGLIANLTHNISFLAWLSYGETIGLSAANPAVLDFSVLRIAFGFEMGINVAQVICIIASLFAYKAMIK